MCRTFCRSFEASALNNSTIMQTNKLFKITFEPDGKDIMVPAGTLLSKAAAAAGIAVEMPCGGDGVCGKCKVKVLSGGFDDGHLNTGLLSREEIESGIRLACKTFVNSDMRVEIPESSRSRVQKILSENNLRNIDVSSGVSKVYAELNPPTVEDGRADFERLADELTKDRKNISLNINVIRSLSEKIRSYDFKLTAVLFNGELIAVERGDTTALSYGIAYDLGSTTIVGYLMNLATGEELGASVSMNSQMAYGDDLISRIQFASTQHDGTRILQKAAVDAMNHIADDLALAYGVSLENIYKVTVVGNTCMTHLLLGVDVAALGQSPFVPAICRDVEVKADELALNICSNASVVVLPNIAGFVGSDMVGVILSSMVCNNYETRLAVDIGTNGEMALFHHGKIYVCSAAAGPAFEGAGISSGVRGGAGAIDSVKIGDRVEITTIDDKPAIGICGSGLVDAVAQMLEAGIVDESGRMLFPSEAGTLSPSVLKRLIKTENGVEFVLAAAEESGTGTRISLNSADVRSLQLAKGSIRAAIETLVYAAGAACDDLSEILLAGAFGNYIGVDSAVRIGLIPNIGREKVVPVGNAAGAGAKLALLSESEMNLAKKIAADAIHVELALSSDYQTALIENMLFSN